MLGHTALADVILAQFPIAEQASSRDILKFNVQPGRMEARVVPWPRRLWQARYPVHHRWAGIIRPRVRASIAAILGQQGAHVIDLYAALLQRRRVVSEGFSGVGGDYDSAYCAPELFVPSKDSLRDDN